jgi:asparagine synthase (glutamine-hydrolysing)
MTAIAGMWRLDGRRDAGDACTRMLAGLHLHGPERSDALSEHELALGRNLLRTLPEDRFDNQPLVGRQGRFVLVADLRLDNRDELIASLKIAPEAAGSQCDAQVLLAAIERWEDGVFERIVGDYAFAAWDKINRTLLLARDPLGWRPLHFHKAERFFAFASMPKGLHALPEIRKAPDEQRLTEWLVQLPPRGSQSFFAEISSE